MVKKTIIRSFLFLLPVAILFAVVEHKVRALPSSPATISAYLTENANHLEVMTLGASQNQAAINPEHMELPTINLSSGHQDYASDNALLQQLYTKLPKLHTVIIPMTFAHFDSPTNGKQYWKNAAYLYYYDVNMFQTSTQFYDEFLFISNPSFYSGALLKKWKGEQLLNYNSYGYIENDAGTAFAKAEYDPLKLSKIPLSINNVEDPREVLKNIKALNELLNFCEEKQLKVVILLTPSTKKHLDARNPAMVKRRDAYLEQALSERSNLYRLDLESAGYNFTEFANHNHLNTKGSKRLSKAVSIFIKELN